MNINPLRLLRRKEHIDDSATAFIEGRETEQDIAALRQRTAREPGLMADLDSVRQTVSLLRSIEPVTAPRSFALSQAPVRASRTARQRLVMAPAVFAIAAAAMVGLLAVGNLANVVRQNDGESSERSGLAESSETTSLAPVAATGTPGTDAGQQESMFQDGLFSATRTAPAAKATASPTLALSAGTVVASTPGDFLAPEFSPSGQFGGTAEIAPDPAQPPLATPDAGALREIEQGRLPQDGGEAFMGTTEAVPGEPDGGAGGQPQQLPLPAPTSVTASGGFGLPVPTSELTDDRAAQQGTPQAPGKDGIALPLWQLQALFAALAVLMAGAWMLLQHRLTGG